MSELLATSSPLAIKTVMGVDVGIVGGLSLLKVDRSLIYCEDMPVLEDGPAGRRTINGALLAGIIKRWRPAQAYVEAVGPRPGEGAVQGFSFGRSFGTILGALAALDVSYSTIHPASWKRLIGIPPGKDGAKDLARSEAIRRWPEHASLFARKRDDGRVEACLIAVAGMMREGGRG